MPDDSRIAMKLEATEVPGRRLAGVRHQGPYPRISEAFARLFPQADALGLSRIAGAVYVAVYYDDPRTTSEDTLRSLAAATVAEDAMIGDLEDARLPSGRYVRTAFFGPHSDLGEAWRHLNHRREQEGYQRRDGVSFEMYLGQEENAPPDRVRTDLYAPIV